MDSRFKCKSWNHKTSRRKLAVNFLPLVLAIFFGYVSSVKRNKSKNKQMRLHKTKKLLHNKGNYQQKPKGHLMNGRRGWYPKYATLEIMQLNIKTNKQTNKQIQFKNGQRTWIDSFHTRHTYSQQHMRRCSTPLILRKMQIKITVRQNGCYKKDKKKQVLARMWRKVNPHVLGGNANWYSHYGK